MNHETMVPRPPPQSTGVQPAKLNRIAIYRVQPPIDFFDMKSKRTGKQWSQRRGMSWDKRHTRHTWGDWFRTKDGGAARMCEQCDQIDVRPPLGS